jgi:hypothetical protein
MKKLLDRKRDNQNSCSEEKLHLCFVWHLSVTEIDLPGYESTEFCYKHRRRNITGKW